MDKKSMDTKDSNIAARKPRGLNLCSINICGMSDRSKMALDKYSMIIALM